MQEPPRLPQSAWSNAANAEDNPFAPSSAGVQHELGIYQPELGSAFWGTFAVLLFACIAGGLVGIPFCWGGAVTILFAAFRVPLLQRWHVRSHPPSRLPNSTTLLFSSWILVITFVCVSSIAFAVVCFPAALISYSSNASGLTLALAGGGLASLISFCTLFYLSMRLSF